MQRIRAHAFRILAAAALWHGLPAYAQGADEFCATRSTEEADVERYGFIVLMRHGKEAKSSADTYNPEGSFKEGCTEEDRLLSSSAIGEVGTVGKFLLEDLSASPEQPMVTKKVVASEHCRTQQTAYALNLVGKTHGARYEVDARINDMSRNCKPDFLKQAAGFIEGLKPKRDELHMLVSHSRTIPCVLKFLGLKNKRIDRKVHNTESVVLQWTNRGLSCVKTIYLGASG